MSEDERKALPNLLDEKVKLEKRIAEMEEEKHLKLVTEIIDLRIALGSIEPEDSQKGIERFRKLDDRSLTVIKEDLERIIEKIVEKQGGLKLDRYKRLIH